MFYTVSNVISDFGVKRRESNVDISFFALALYEMPILSPSGFEIYLKLLKGKND